MADDSGYDWDEMDRSKRIFFAIIRGEAKEDYAFEKDSDRAIWDTLKREIEDIYDQGGIPDWPSEIPDFDWADEDFARVRDPEPDPERWLE